MHVPDQKRRKLDKKSLKCVLIGYDGDDSYRVWHQESNSVLRSRDVWFNHEMLFKPKDSIETPISFGPLNAGETNVEDCSRDYIDGNEMHPNNDKPVHDNDKGEACNESETDCSTDRQLRDRASIKKPIRLQVYVTCAERFVLQDAEPESYDEALQSERRKNWTEAMQSEMSSLNENETWTLVQLPDGRKAIPCKWVYKTKYNPDGSIDRFNARLVIKGYSQRRGVDYSQTFSPVARTSSIRALISVAASLLVW